MKIDLITKLEKSLYKHALRKKYCIRHELQLGISKRCWLCEYLEDQIIVKDSRKRDQRWSRAIKKRDKVCQGCGKTKEEGKLQAHHIKSRSKYPDLRYDLSNGITLCLDCHAKEHPDFPHLILCHKDRVYYPFKKQ